jgi:aromatic-amino-acid transaminase
MNATAATLAASDLFTRLERQPPDALLAIIAAHRADPRPDTIDLGVGVYRDDAGRTPVLRAVKTAEARLLAGQDSKSYLGADGDVRYVELLETILFGDAAPDHSHLTGVQTPGGTGALRLGAELIARANPAATIWMGEPTWPNHAPIFREAGLPVAMHPFYDLSSGTIRFDEMITALDAARPGDILLLHGCCHNPTGAELATDEWAAIAGLVARRGLIPFIDLAYQGLGDGLEEDAAATRRLLDAVPEALIAYSCDKNFGLYRERVGALWVKAGDAGGVVRQNMLTLARSLWSMPPDHGAAIVRVILDDAAMTADWRAELDEMRDRLNRLRRELAASHPRLAAIARQRGMFAMLPIDTAAIAMMRERHGIYMTGGGRISIAGLNAETLPRFSAALAPCLDG